MDYHWSLMTEEERRDAARDMGVALGWAARSLRSSPQFAKIAATQGLPLLETAVRDQPDDLTARESLGHVFEILDRPEDALHAFEAVTRNRTTPRIGPPFVRPRCWPASIGLSSPARRCRRRSRSTRGSPTIAWRWLWPAPGRRLARGRRGLPRGDPAQP